MKTIHLFLILALSFLLTNCQKEEEEIITPPSATPENIIAGSPLAKLISRTAQNPTECDNVLDNCSGFSIQLPATVTVNGNQVVVASKEDYQTVQNIKDNVSGNDIVYFSYPITVVFKNFSTQNISNYAEFHDLVQNCGSDDGLNEIDCITLNYPIVINTYNANNQVANTLTFQNNTQLYSFITGLNSMTIAAIVYPISGVNSNGDTVVINSNGELENFIDSSIDDCDDSGVINPSFTSVLTTGNWYVSYFNEDGEIQTDDFGLFHFTFFGNGSIEVTKNSLTTLGSWTTYIDGGYNKIELDFVNPDLDELAEDWIILEYTTTVIRLKHVSGGGGGTDYLNFTKN